MAEYVQCPDCNHKNLPIMIDGRTIWPDTCENCGGDISTCDVLNGDLTAASQIPLPPVPQAEAIPEKEIEWVLISEDARARLTLHNGDSYDVGREHTLSDYLMAFSNVGRLQARIYAENDQLFLLSLGTTNQTMVDRRCYFASQTVELQHDSIVILGRRPDEMNGFDDHERCAFFKVEKR